MRAEASFSFFCLSRWKIVGLLSASWRTQVQVLSTLLNRKKNSARAVFLFLFYFILPLFLALFPIFKRGFPVFFRPWVVDYFEDKLAGLKREQEKAQNKALKVRNISAEGIAQ